jgi:molybdenum cofactor cytidylyltransferase
MRIVGILLAAGRATRFGGAMLLAPLASGSSRGSPAQAIGSVAAQHLVDALAEAIAVVRPGDARLAQRLRDAGLSTVECAHAAAGMGASLACGVVAAKDADAWVVALADMPWIAPATIGAVACQLNAGADIVAPTYRGVRGHPVGFARRHYAALAALTTDIGARSLIDCSDRLTLIAVDDPGVTRDVDTPDDLQPPR